MSAFNELLDLEAQTAAHNAAQRAEHTAAADDDGARWIAGRWWTAEEMPDARDVAEMERWG
ncbi:MAG TPA: hypothetical protein VFJ14_07705 [Nocardioidaceae bacterium]|nr:hypothetical protein [Nocardioidaceae bacterium]